MNVEPHVQPPQRAAALLGQVMQRRSPAWTWAILLLTVAIASAYVAWCLPRRGWIAHDEGALGESAVRVMAGEVPHRDFTEIYTGGLAYLNAAAFRMFGVSTMTTRWVLFAFIVPAIAAMFYVLTRFLAPLAASACTLVAVAWSFPNYTSAMPSWYNLVFAIFAVAAVLRFIDSEARVWLLLAGMCAGLSFLAKLPGIYLLAGVLLFLLFDEQSTAAVAGTATDRSYRAVLAAALLLALAVLFRTVHRVAGAAVLYDFFLPLAAVGALLVAHEPGLGRISERLRRVFRLWFPVLMGAAAPVLIFTFFMRGVLRELVYGVLVLPQQRFLTTTAHLPPPLWTAAAALPLLAALGAAVFRRSRISVFAWTLFAESLLIALVKAPDDQMAYRMGTYPVWTLATPIVLIGCISVWLRRGAVPAADVRRTVLVLAVLASCALVQFPFSTIIYFCYIAPLVMFAVAGVLRLLPRLPHPAVGGALLAYLAVHAVLFMVPTGLHLKERAYWPEAMVPLELERAGGLRIRYEERDHYQNAIRLLRRHATGGYTYCALDCSDVYFYSGLRNPTPILFDEFDDPRGRNQRILGALERHAVTAVLLEPSLFLGGIPADLAAELERRYPHAQSFGPMQVRWR